MKNLLLMLFVAVAVSCVAPQATACDCGGGGGGCFGLGYGFLYNSLDFRVPYFAAHPPVYYSQPVPRTYGYSPFAYPPYVRTPEIVYDAIEPVTIVNPYANENATDAGAGEEAADAASSDKTAQAGSPGPLVIMNPYVDAKAAIVQVAD